MYCRYSSMVVAPMHRSCPLASAGLRRFDASMDPDVAPAPTTVCISSMKSMISPSLSLTRSTTFFSRSSNSPRYDAPAIRAPMSRPTRRHSLIESGTSPLFIRCAMPSAMAVLPTPGSPMRTGLFFVRRERIWIARLISSSRPITGSSFPSAALAVKSTPNCSNTSSFISEMSFTSLLSTSGGDDMASRDGRRETAGSLLSPPHDGGGRSGDAVDAKPPGEGRTTNAPAGRRPPIVAVAASTSVVGGLIMCLFPVASLALFLTLSPLFFVAIL
mmetsp:Transcript_20018/g.45191  ORF Transcript_20018/g.45191 Transcript_20018/m.45191 type:complete len:273 (-) Transcript_20018:32-850(-)